MEGPYNASGEPPPTAGAQRTLLAVGSSAWLGGVSCTDSLPLSPRKRSLVKVISFDRQRRTGAFATSVTREIAARLLLLGAGVAGARQFDQLGEVVPRLVAVAGLRRRLPRTV
jgi:hypothetical protein